MNTFNHCSSTAVTSVDLSNLGQFAITGGIDTTVKVWDVNTGNLLKKFKGHTDSISFVKFTTIDMI